MYSEILNLAAGPRLLFVTTFRLQRDRTEDNSVKTKQKTPPKKQKTTCPFSWTCTMGLWEGWGFINYTWVSRKRTPCNYRIHLLLASAIQFRATGTPSIKRTFPEEENLVKSGCQLEKTNHGIAQQNDFLLLFSFLSTEQSIKERGRQMFSNQLKIDNLL